MQKYFNSEKPVRLGDKVRYFGTPGEIVFVVDDASYSDRFPREHWAPYLEKEFGKGFGVELQDWGLFVLLSAEEEEDLEPVVQERDAPGDKE
jgi:23S rRNA G2445 N2-methylase RlmL